MNKKPNTSGLKPYEFQPGKSGNKAGRPPKCAVPKSLKAILGEDEAKAFEELSEIDIATWEKTLMAMTTGQLKKVVTNTAVNAYVQALAKNILTDMEAGTAKTVERLRERQYE
jgi:hypothetical protein